MTPEPTTTTQADRDTVIVLARDQASFFEFVKPRQESGGRTIVILDRREGERRRNGNGTAVPERRKADRRHETPEAAMALMSVLGFMILHKDGDHWAP